MPDCGTQRCLLRFSLDGLSCGRHRKGGGGDVTVMVFAVLCDGFLCLALLTTFLTLLCFLSSAVFRRRQIHLTALNTELLWLFLDYTGDANGLFLLGRPNISVSCFE